jgi:hypothetical protein
MQDFSFFNVPISLTLVHIEIPLQPKTNKESISYQETLSSESSLTCKIVVTTVLSLDII